MARLYYPAAKVFRTTQTFAQHSWPYDGGIDWAFPNGTKILAPADGRIAKAYADNTGYGNLMIVQHQGYQTWYGHCLRFKKRSGEVKTGDVIAISDNTGRSTGPHLHFGVKTSGFIDPNKWLRRNSNGQYITADKAVIIPPPVQPPLEESMKGRFISEHNGTINAQKMKENGAEFVYIRSSVGDRMDSRFVENIAKCQAADLLVGAVHYVYPSKGAGQFDRLADLGGHILDLPVVLDVEEKSTYSKQYMKNLLLEAVKVWSNPSNITWMYSPTYWDWNERWSAKYFGDVHDHWGWPWLSIYSSRVLWTQQVEYVPSWYYLPGWFAHWDAQQPAVPKPWSEHPPGWYMHQYSCRLPGAESGECTSQYICGEQINPAIPQFIKTEVPPPNPVDSVRVTVGVNVDGKLYGPGQVDLLYEERPS